MKKSSKKFLAFVLCTATVAGILSGCGGKNPASPGAAGKPEAKSITVDGGYQLDFSPKTFAYEIHVPAGRPRIPKLTAEADGQYEVSVAQAVLADGAEKGTAYVTVSAQSGEKTEYAVTFVRDAALGFHLQYDDCYAYLPENAAQVAKFTSSAPDVISVTKDGTLHANALSETPVTVTALDANGGEIGKLTVDKVVKAPLNIFLITGQSNAYGTYDIPAGADTGAFMSSQIAKALRPDEGTVLCTDVTNTGTIQQDMYDLSAGRAGFSPALGKAWYDLTGEKTLMIQTAVGGAPIEAWIKPENGERYTYGNISGNFYENTANAYEHTMQVLGQENCGYELNRVHAYWLQGETGMASSFNPNKLGMGIGDWDFGSTNHIVDQEEYFNTFTKIAENFKADFGCEFVGILLVRAVQEVCSSESLSQQLLTDLVPARAAQYALHNQNSEYISIVSRVCEIARMESYSDMNDAGWGLMGCNNLHYNQAGHNANGLQAAVNTYKRLYGREEQKATELEVILENGRDRVEDGGEVLVLAGAPYQTAAMVLPLYTDTPVVSYQSADESICSVDKYGTLHPAEDAAGKETTITYRCEAAGLEKTIHVKVGTRQIKEISYEWNFNNNDLTEASGSNNMTVSEKTGGNAAYSIHDGIYTSTNSLTNFKLEKPFRISSDTDWTIEWRGVVTTNSALFGTANDTTNFMYIAYSVPFEVENPMRIVGSTGNAIMIPYGIYAGYNTSGMNTWKVQYTASTGRVMLYLNNSIAVGTAEMPAGWSAEFTNMFGSYVAGVDVDYQGSIDWIKVKTAEITVSY